jgi:hypothetical protein
LDLHLTPTLPVYKCLYINVCVNIQGITETHSALYLLKDEGFKGSRPNVPNIGVVITDGKSFHTNLTASSASELKSQGKYFYKVKS